MGKLMPEQYFRHASQEESEILGGVFHSQTGVTLPVAYRYDPMSPMRREMHSFMVSSKRVCSIG